ncbi:MAG: MotA/TolQ/ExbB proton channel family protein [Chlamydiae bacterium]|nr:MotA/TolQ/ExbB proton channel family protein [Chlamydiota bacterium]MBI3265991.1 MotA/TolQ/ExbB proton channel family protein [Chlamydiota bacterium]
MMGSFIHVDIVGIIIIIVLTGLSVYGWAIFLHKLKLLRAIEKGSTVFLEKFRRVVEPTALFRENYSRLEDPSPLIKIYKGGCKELDHLLKASETGSPVALKGTLPKISILELESLQKMLQRIASEEMMNLEKSLSVLATASSVSPLLGLLGTVWGIMVAFIGISRKGNASIAAVAPGVAVALITTVIGLLVAIPALVAYNFFQTRINTLSLKTDNFISEFLGGVERKYVIR